MRSSDLLIAGRRKAGLSQHELGERVARPQSTIARWETGRQRPPLESVIEALHACGIELTVGLRKYDDSYFSLIGYQLLREPAERVRHLARREAGYEPIEMLCELAKDARFVVIGNVAGAFNGSPVVLGRRTLHIAPADTSTAAVENAARRLGAEPAGNGEDGSERWVLESVAELHVSRVPPGTGGYRDLVRDAETVQIAPGVSVSVASVIDLIRIAESSIGPWARTSVPALWATLEMRQHQAKRAPG